MSMLEQYAPPSVVVDERLDVVHLSSGAGRYLRLAEGNPSHRIMELAQGELRLALRTSLHEAFVEDLPTTRQVLWREDGAEARVNVHVRPPVAKGRGRYALIVFEDIPAMAPSAATEGASTERAGEVDLEQDLRRTRAQLETTSAAYDRTVADFQTVHEELLSINEEQKAAAEELETGREEIQSINEELTTINQEHRSTIEELKRTNGDLQNLIESTEIGTIFLDLSMRIRRFTPSAATLFNFMAADHGRPLVHITHRLDYPEMAADVGRVLETLTRIEREVTSDAGESYIVRINPYRSLDGKADGAVLTLFDNTARHRIDAELRAAKAVAESANVAKGAFLATLSHEFRTPLNAILGYADLLPLDEDLSAAQHQKVERIKAATWHLVAMIDEVLSFARLDGGHEVVQQTGVDAWAIASAAKALMEPAAHAKGLAFVLEPSDTPVQLETDPGKARQVLINLCGNAVAYNESGEVRVAVREEDGHVVFEVRDTGIGISAEHQKLIFDRFWRVDGGPTRASGGLGIGLAAAREYGRLLGGDVEVESEQGKGSTFRFWLPRAHEGDASRAGRRQ
jgi:two-component system CheB/CheR fusion protein